MPATPLYLRLSGVYFFYFATLGVMLPYWPLYLESKGLSPAQIGEIMAVVLATKIVGPNLGGWIGDTTGRRMVLVRGACFAAAVAFAGVFWVSGSFAQLMSIMALFSLFWNGALPQFEVTTLNHLGSSTHRYSAIRLWGSIGFIVASIAVGALLEHSSMTIVPVALMLLFVVLWLASLTVPEAASQEMVSDRQPFGPVLRQGPVATLLLVCFLVQASHGPYYAFFSIYLERLDYGPEVIGGLWSLGVAAEIGVFLLMHRLLLRFGARRLMLCALLLTCLRWLLIGGFADSLMLLVFAQTLHAFSFGVYHAVAIHLIHRFFRGGHQGRGQALYSSIGFGVGGATGNLAAGYLWEPLGPESTFVLAAAISAIAWAVAWRGLRE